ncbi:hypothetical protein MNBD_GAMMA12-1658 [hydrothermal vent metagenome]|uniref:Uncharacterized protein n=1 Tax=hydrothermal vent metagenome TaxID=652676 RepID=A0A3B0YUT0_9ZZZZ
MKCIYVMDWYELDQSVVVGQVGVFYFLENSEPPQFYCGLFSNANSELRSCKIYSIHHPELGQIRELNTKGLDYTITLVNGKSFEVNAEEEPGKVFGFPMQPKDWKFEIDVKFEQRP